MRFRDRTDAGVELAARLGQYRDRDVVVLALPRGGVPVAAEVAAALDAPLDTIVVRKLGVPHHPELAMGAIGEDGVRVLDDEIVRAAHVSDAEIAAVEASERRELARRSCRYRGSRVPIPVRHRTVVIVDDGMATGSTASAACRVARERGASEVVLAVPVASAQAVAELSAQADDLVYVVVPRVFRAVGLSYDEFWSTPDEEVVRLLELHRAPDPTRDESVVLDPAQHADISDHGMPTRSA